MTINVDEKYREIIEQEYGSIIKFKRVFYLRFGMNNEIISIINRLMETGLENIINSIHIWLENVKEIFYTISDTINKLFKPIKEIIDTLKPIFINIEYQKCYFVKEYEKVPLRKYEVTVLHLPVMFHCRNNC